MDQVSQYLRAVAALLPRHQRADITAELRDVILSRVEAREAMLGRPLTDDEIEQELRVVGHPIVVAARYGQEPQHLVGPSLYPYWMFGVKIAFAVQATAVLVLITLRTLKGQDLGNALGHAIGQGVMGFITLVGVATVAGWAIERRKIHVTYLDRWRVRDLLVLEYAGWGFTDFYEHFRQPRANKGSPRDGRPHHNQSSPISRAISMVVFGTVFALWWVGTIHLAVFDHPEDLGTVAGLNLGDLHSQLFWPVLVYSAAVIAQGSLVLLYPRASRVHGAITILMGTVVLAFCIWSWTASPFAAALHANSMAQLVQALKLDLRNGPPFALAPILTVCLGSLAFAGLINIVAGIRDILVPATNAP